jgi:hypothetical protein
MPRHAIAIRKSHLMRGRRHIESLQRRLQGASHKTEKAFERGMSTVLSTATAGGIGLIHGRHGPVEVLGVPLELAVGAGAAGASIFGFGGKYAHLLNSVGNGALGVYGYLMGRGAGENWAKKAGAGKTPSASVTGLPSQSLGSEEFERMTRPVDAQRATE